MPRLANAAVAVLLTVTNGASALCPTIGRGVCSLSSSSHRPARSPLEALKANAYDDWYQARRARNTVIASQVAAATQENAAAFNTGSAAGRAALRAARAEAAKAAEAATGAEQNTLPLDKGDFRWTSAMLSGEASLNFDPSTSSNVGVVLTEFVQSDYARQVFNFRRVPGTDYGTIRGMFQSVQLVSTRLELKTSMQCQNVEGLFERLAMYLRARIPDITEIHEMHKDGMNIH